MASIKMEETYIELIEAPELALNITEFNPEFAILNDRSEKSSSGVWKHFGTIKHRDAVDKKHVYCKICFYNRRIKKYQRSTSTGNLSKHLRKQHNISLNQTFRVKKDPDNSIHLIKKEDGDNEIDPDKNTENYNTIEGDDEYLVHDINEILISEVAKRPLLYKSQACQQEKGSKHLLRRQQWTEVYDALNHLIPITKLPKIWKNIRDRYHKVRRVASIVGEEKPKYRYYDQLSFLDPVMEDQKVIEYEQTEEETDVEEFLISGDHDHYISSEAIVLQNDAVEYEEAIDEPRAKKQKLSPKKQQTTYQIITDDITKNKVGKTIAISASNIIEESFANATSNDIFTTFEEVSDDLKPSTMLNHGPNIEVISSTPIAVPSNIRKDEFDIFGNLIAEMIRNMAKPKQRVLQLNIMKLIAETENED